MGFKETLDSIARVFKLSRKPRRQELILSIRICLVGFGVVGFFGFVIQLIATLLAPAGG
ncbi:MAG: protein translocase SEC61 complex subunit gamma [Candidatus Methanomethylicota archaeon]|uniref:Protein translocase subunit SecE n=1 Tax=Thermoproteota archaeon TaxID=2056631 RepID=A0A497ERI7_9CREN|nr:MAG: protein translocase SEC61 complex subunit gamma [Candidatus Verstraetearchaeota archaeon]